MNATRTPIVWDISDSAAWLADMLGETQRHRAALTAQWPSDMRIGYFHGQTHMVPADEAFNGTYGPVTPLCGTVHHGMVETDTVTATPCNICTRRYNEGATTGVKPDPFPIGTPVEFDTRLGSTSSTMRGVVVEPTSPGYNDYRRVQVNPAGLCTNIHVKNLTVIG